jgi:hypothetical protein
MVSPAAGSTVGGWSPRDHRGSVAGEDVWARRAERLFVSRSGRGRPIWVGVWWMVRGVCWSGGLRRQFWPTCSRSTPLWMTLWPAFRRHDDVLIRLGELDVSSSIGVDWGATVEVARREIGVVCTGAV